jgi:hypothetical protein
MACWESGPNNSGVLGLGEASEVKTDAPVSPPTSYQLNVPLKQTVRAPTASAEGTFNRLTPEPSL